MEESTPASSSIPSQQQSAAYKAHMLHKKITQEEAQLNAKKLASESHRSIAPGTRRLFPLPPSELQLDGLSGQASSGRFIVRDGAVTLDESASDGDGRKTPSAERQRREVDEMGKVSYYVQLTASEDAHKHWAKLIGKLVAYHMFGQSEDSVHWWIRLPSGYTLWQHIDGLASDEKNARKDVYLYGSTTYGTSRTHFRSPAEFAPHFMWLMLGRPEGECRCKYCSHRSQDEVSAELFGYPSKKEIQSVKGTRRGTARNEGTQSPEEDTDAGGRPVIAENNTQGNVSTNT